MNIGKVIGCILIIVTVCFACNPNHDSTAHSQSLNDTLNDEVKPSFSFCFSCDSSFKAEVEAYTPQNYDMPKAKNSRKKRNESIDDWIARRDHERQNRFNFIRYGYPVKHETLSTTSANIEVRTNDMGNLFIIIKKERSKSRDSKISLLNEQGDTLEKVIRRTDLNTDYTINSSKSNLKKTLSKSFRNSSKQEVYKVPTDILSQLQQGLDTLTVTLNRTYVAKENGQSFSLENPPTELQIFYHVPKFYEVLVSIDEVSFNKNSKDRIVEGLERSDPDLGISVSVGNNNIYRHYRNNCYHLYPIDPFIIYHTAIDNDVKVTIFDDDIFGDDYYLSKEVKLINLIKEDYSYFNNDIISHSGIKMRIVGTRN